MTDNSKMVAALQQRDAANSAGSVFGMFLLACLFFPALFLLLVPLFGKTNKASVCAITWRDVVISFTIVVLFLLLVAPR